MTTEIMSDWLMKFNRKMVQNKRKVMLLIDNARPCPHLKMKNVKLANQPFDQEIIQQFKKVYCTKLLRKAVANHDNFYYYTYLH